MTERTDGRLILVPDAVAKNGRVLAGMLLESLTRPDRACGLDMSIR